MRKQILMVISATILSFAAPCPAITLSITPATQNLSIGDFFSVAVNIAGLGAGTAPSLSGFDLDLGFDPAIIGYMNTQFGDPGLGDQLDLSGAGLNNPLASLSAGNVNLVEVSLLDTPDDLNQFQANQFVLATLSFQTLKAGFSALSLSINPGGLPDADGVQLSAGTEFGTVNVKANDPTPNPIPEPPIYILLLSGLLIQFKCWRKKNATSRMAVCW